MQGPQLQCSKSAKWFSFPTPTTHLASARLESRLCPLLFYLQVSELYKPGFFICTMGWKPFSPQANLVRIKWGNLSAALTHCWWEVRTWSLLLVFTSPFLLCKPPTSYPAPIQMEWTTLFTRDFQKSWVLIRVSVLWGLSWMFHLLT